MMKTTRLPFYPAVAIEDWENLLLGLGLAVQHVVECARVQRQSD